MTGPSGVGKGTLIRALLERRSDLTLSVSATTRPPRPGEEEGISYWFLEPTEFERRVEAGEFIEHATYSGHRYGTLWSELARGRGPLVLEIELQGARQIRARAPHARQVFVRPPSLDALRARLVGRGSDPPEQMERRLETARTELAAEGEFEHVVCNDRLEDAVQELLDLVATIWPQPDAGATPT